MIKHRRYLPTHYRETIIRMITFQQIQIIVIAYISLKIISIFTLVQQ